MFFRRAFNFSNESMVTINYLTRRPFTAITMDDSSNKLRRSDSFSELNLNVAIAGQDMQDPSRPNEQSCAGSSVCFVYNPICSFLHCAFFFVLVILCFFCLRLPMKGKKYRNYLDKFTCFHRANHVESGIRAFLKGKGMLATKLLSLLIAKVLAGKVLPFIIGGAVFSWLTLKIAHCAGGPLPSEVMKMEIDGFSNFILEVVLQDLPFQWQGHTAFMSALIAHVESLDHAFCTLLFLNQSLVYLLVGILIKLLSLRLLSTGFASLPCKASRWPAPATRMNNHHPQHNPALALTG